MGYDYGSIMNLLCTAVQSAYVSYSDLIQIGILGVAVIELIIIYDKKNK